MKKLVLSLAITSALGLSACDSETIKDVEKDVEQNNETIVPSARVIFDPSGGKLSIPNDLIFQGTTDGTLNVPNIVDPTDFSNPLVAVSALDGWSTQQPFAIELDFPTGVTLDSGSVFNPAAVHIYEMVMGGDISDTDCGTVARGLACKLVGELTFGSDFVARAQGNSVAIVPLKPLKPKTTYVIALTDTIQDSLGRSVQGSSSYKLVKQDISTQPLGSEAQLGLQAVINSFETAVSGAGVDKENIIYTAAMTTQSTTDVLNIVKQLVIADPNAMPVVSVSDTGLSVAEALIAGGQISATDQTLVPLYSAANLMAGSITLPYYSAIPTDDDEWAPLNSFWKARCDSGATIAGLAAASPESIPEEPVSANDAFCDAFGLRDLGIDAERNLTKFNPIPQATTMVDVPVQMTMPDVTFANGVRASMNLPPLEQPESGWPVVMLQHGITSKKEDMLAITGLLSVYGFATAAIDHPLHGSRGFDIKAEADGDEINATDVSVAHYLNIQNLLAMRDNGRQSVADMLGFRVGLNFVPGIDSSQVHFLGQSLGSIAGFGFTALANTSLNPAVDPLFKVNTASLAVPGGGIPHFMMESPSFGNLIKSNLLYAASTDFQGYVQATQGEITPNSPEWTNFLISAFENFFANVLTTEQQIEVAGIFTEYTFAWQTVLDSADPNNFATLMLASETPVLIQEVVGDGDTNLQDQVIPNSASTLPNSGTEGLVNLLGLPGITETTQSADSAVSGVVRYLYGHHGSLLTPAVTASAPNALNNALVTQEMQSQVANFIASEGHVISVQETSVVKQ